ncbi:MAG: signal peptidase I [Armatimonadetes bacterium]|nr:signal peptidase I [Armatimonadota bacterium]
MSKRPSRTREAAQTLLVTGFVFVLIETFLFQGFRVYGSCMEPSLYTGERLLGNKLLYRLHPPQRGDIIVFRYPNDPTRIYVKRVIGLPGETVAIRGGEVHVNGRRLREDYVVNGAHGEYPSTRVPRNRLFVLGDNRDHSSDSRSWGTVPWGHVEGKVWFRYWPLTRAGSLE